MEVMMGGRGGASTVVGERERGWGGVCGGESGEPQRPGPPVVALLLPVFIMGYSSGVPNPL